MNVKPVKDLNLPFKELSELIKPSYEVPDANDYWNKTFTEHLKTDLIMSETSTGSAQYFKKHELIILIGQHDDESLQAGENEFLEDTEKILKKFVSRSWEHEKLNFSGIRASSKQQNILLSQKQYIEKPKPFAKTAFFPDLSSLRSELVREVCTKPDICLLVSSSTQISEKFFRPEDMESSTKFLNIWKQQKTVF